jgi:AcrR family transcriptional regulator
MPSEVSEPATTRRVGRPARINRDSIASAVLEIGFDDATMKRVAEHLGVSVPGLYYYVRGRDDLLRVAAAYSLARTALPEDRGQHWAQWLREWALYMRAAMAERELMEQFIAGELNDDRMVDVMGQAIDVLVRHGFTAPAALQAWETISSVAVGAAVGDMRARQRMSRDGIGDAHLSAVVAARDLGHHPELRLMLDVPDTARLDATFAERVTTVLVGIATRNDLPIDDEIYGDRGPRREPSAPPRRAKRQPT